MAPITRPALAPTEIVPELLMPPLKVEMPATKRPVFVPEMIPPLLVMPPKNVCGVTNAPTLPPVISPVLTMPPPGELAPKLTTVLPIAIAAWPFGPAEVMVPPLVRPAVKVCTLIEMASMPPEMVPLVLTMPAESLGIEQIDGDGLRGDQAAIVGDAAEERRHAVGLDGASARSGHGAGIDDAAAECREAAADAAEAEFDIDAAGQSAGIGDAAGKAVPDYADRRRGAGVDLTGGVERDAARDRAGIVDVALERAAGKGNPARGDGAGIGDIAGDGFVVDAIAGHCAGVVHAGRRHGRAGGKRMWHAGADHQRGERIRRQQMPEFRQTGAR